MTGVDVSVESWEPGYGSALRGDDDLVPTPGPVDVGCEVPLEQWGPRSGDPAVGPAGDVLFVDGVRRIDAQLWLTDARGTRPGIAVSYAAGIVRCDGTATVEASEIRRGVFGQAPMPRLETRAATYEPMVVAGEDPESIVTGVQDRLGDLEKEVARDAPSGDLIVVDGPLSGRQNIPGAIGYVKTHHRAYLTPPASEVVPQLAPGQRTPLFVTQTTWSRFSWYVRLPHGQGHPWAGVVRCEASADLTLQEAVRLADVSAATLPRFASEPHKDPRAPQNLYPIAGLERRLKRLLGDPGLLNRALRVAAAGLGGGART